MLRRSLMGLLLFLLLPLATMEASPPPDSACLVMSRALTDSAAKRHLSSTTLTAYQLRALRRLDSLHVASCDVSPTATIVTLVDSTTIAVGSTALVCGVFTTSAGDRGLLGFTANTIVNSSATATLAPDTSASELARCSRLAAARGLPLTPKLSLRPATWEIRSP